MSISRPSHIQCDNETYQFYQFTIWQSHTDHENNYLTFRAITFRRRCWSPGKEPHYGRSTGNGRRLKNTTRLTGGDCRPALHQHPVWRRQLDRTGTDGRRRCWFTNHDQFSFPRINAILKCSGRSITPFFSVECDRNVHQSSRLMADCEVLRKKAISDHKEQRMANELLVLRMSRIFYLLQAQDITFLRFHPDINPVTRTCPTSLWLSIVLNYCTLYQ